MLNTRKNLVQGLFKSYEKTCSEVIVYKFNSKELDAETGLYYYGARYYSPDKSIWLSVDQKSDDYPHQSPYMFCSGNPVVRVDMDGMSDDNYETNEATGITTVQRTNDATNTYTLKKINGETANLGTCEKNGNMVKLDQSTDFYEQALYSNGKNYIDADAASGFLTAAYLYKQETGDKVKVNQLMSIDGEHSGKRKNMPCIDIQYGSSTNEQAETQKFTVDYAKTGILINNLKKFGFNNMPNNYNFLTENGDKFAQAIIGTQYWPGHRNHVHVQGFNQKQIIETK